MPEAYVVDAARTPMGAYRGALSGVRPDDLAAHAIRAVVDRTGVDPEQITDVYFGAANQSGEDNRDVARMGALLAGLPASVPGATVNRLCASGLEAVNAAARAVKLGEGDLYLAGGVESMSRAPWVVEKPERGLPRGERTMHDTTLGWRLVNPRMAELGVSTESMGETAENVAEQWEVGRDLQDAFALGSQQKAVAAIESGRFDDQIVPISVPQRKGEPIVVARDEHPRADASAEALAKLRPAFRDGGTVTAGNSSGINDGASAVLLVEAGRARELGLKPLARVVSTAVAGVDPAVMGIGPVPASRKALQRAGITAAELDLVELNEAFASQSIVCINELGLDSARVNVNGGAIALGHPLGASGGRLITMLVHELRRTGGRYGLATMCIGVGQGIATVVERLEA
jgi:3-oxoadipyl-CoA thiolase